MSFSPRAAASAAPPDHGPPAVQRRIASQWDDLTPPEKKRAMQNYQLYEKLTPKERHVIDQLYERWRKLPPSDRQRFREQHDHHRGEVDRTNR